MRLGREPSTNYQSHRQQTSSQCPSDIAAKDLSGLANEVMLYQTNAPIGDASLHAWADAQALWSGLARFQGIPSQFTGMRLLFRAVLSN